MATESMLHRGSRDVSDFDFRLQHPFTAVISDPSNSGKSYLQEASGNKEIERVFTQYAHHRNLSAIYIVQNLFVQGKSSRTISLNTNYLILFKNTRDANQVSVLGRQMYPGNAKYFMECYQDATS